MGTVEATCYKETILAIITLDLLIVHDETVPITTVHQSWCSSGAQCSCFQLPLKLERALKINKSQGLTLNKLVIDVGKEFYCRLTFAACSRGRKLRDILFMPSFPLQ